ncbi:hypothetical protein HUX88_30710 [Duganella sp. BJB1802]|uniref:hypothetical protein n=1 Tax=Duganella sp. BJB1802 TaxID=2744575 RepID=UPI0015944AA7|nr:hypothetical protein [Duganella sp. BJB1802]NVD74858.1 hypothetical protein [Duganella sp. BJB1802]
MRKLAVTNFSTFPAPVHEGSSTLWHLVDVLRWMLPRGGYKVDQVLLMSQRPLSSLTWSSKISSLSLKYFIKYRRCWRKGLNKQMAAICLLTPWHKKKAR